VISIETGDSFVFATLESPAPRNALSDAIMLAGSRPETRALVIVRGAGGTAQFGMPGVRLGLPPAQIAPFVAARHGHGAALRLMLTGQRIGPTQALGYGLADDVLEPEALNDGVNALLDELGRAEQAALRATKAILQKRHTDTLAATLDFASITFATALRSGTAEEGIDAASAKRAAPWVTRPGETTE
jgi:isohexenylglutaconyl-CoA hydratase